MANTNIAVGGANSFSASNAHHVHVETFILDFEKNPASAADTIEIINIPAKSIVIGSSCEVMEAEGAVLTLNVGDAGLATQYATALDGNVLAQHAGTASPAYQSAADTVLVTVATGNPVLAKIRVTLVLANVTGK